MLPDQNSQTVQKLYAYIDPQKGERAISKSWSRGVDRPTFATWYLLISA